MNYGNALKIEHEDDPPLVLRMYHYDDGELGIMIERGRDEQDMVLTVGDIQKLIWYLSERFPEWMKAASTRDGPRGE